MFLHIPKCAGVTVRITLEKALQGRMLDFDTLDEAHREERHPGLANHFPIWRVEQLLREINLEELIQIKDLRSFMVVRNPWERMASLYAHRFSKRHLSYQGKPRNTPQEISVIEQGFEAWLLHTPSPGDQHLIKTAQSDWGKDEDGHFAVNAVLHVENFAEDWECLCLDWDLPYRKAGKHNAGLTPLSKNYRANFTDEMREHVAEHFAEDIERWNYAF